MDDDAREDPALTDEQRQAVDRLTASQVAAIDRALLSHVPHRWGKVARVVGKAMQSLGDERVKGVPDLYYAERIRFLAESGVIESVGNLKRMRFSEIRRPRSPDGAHEPSAVLDRRIPDPAPQTHTAQDPFVGTMFGTRAGLLQYAARTRDYFTDLAGTVPDREDEWRTGREVAARWMESVKNERLTETEVASLLETLRTLECPGSQLCDLYRRVFDSAVALGLRSEAEFSWPEDW